MLYSSLHKNYINYLLEGMKSVLKKYSFICYALIAIGQLWLYNLNLRTTDIYERATDYSNEWLGSHVILLYGAMFIFPATWVVKEFCGNKNKYLVYTASALTFIGAAGLIGQYILNFYLVSLFDGLESDAAYDELNQIFSNKLITFVCYDLIAVWVIGQILFIVALVRHEKYPKWALGLLILGLIMVIFGDGIHELFERLSYLLISIALIPIFSEIFLSGQEENGKDNTYKN